MSWQALDWVRKQRVGHAHSKAILVQLANLADERGSCFPSHEYLAEQVEISERTIQDCMKRLEVDGYVLSKRDRLDNGRMGLTRYSLCLGREPSTPPEATSDGPPEAPPEKPPEAASGETLRDTSVVGERERAREAVEHPTPAEALETLRSSWPDFALESQGLALTALSALTATERQQAVDRVPDFLVFHREKRGKAKLPYLHNYLAEKARWQDIPEKAKAPAKVEDPGRVPAFKRTWWWLFKRAALSGSNDAIGALRLRVSAAVSFGGAWPVDPTKRAEYDALAEAELAAFAVDTQHAIAWRTYYLTIGITMPIPDKVEWVFLPTHGPPDMGKPISEQNQQLEREGAG